MLYCLYMHGVLIPLLLLGLAVVFIVAGIYYNKAKRYKKELKEAEDALHTIYDEIYVADRLTAFVKRLETISKQAKTPQLKLSDVHSDLRQYTKTVEQRIRSPFGDQLVVLKDEAARDELERLRSKLISRRKS